MNEGAIAFQTVVENDVIRLPEEYRGRFTSPVLVMVREKTAAEEGDQDEQGSYELGEMYFGRHGSGKGSLSKEYKTLVKEKLRARYGAH